MTAVGREQAVGQWEQLTFYDMTAADNLLYLLFMILSALALHVTSVSVSASRDLLTNTCDVFRNVYMHLKF
jgi:hypothetical protein